MCGGASPTHCQGALQPGCPPVEHPDQVADDFPPQLVREGHLYPVSGQKGRSAHFWGRVLSLRPDPSVVPA